MGRRVERTRCSGQWTEARYNGFVKNQLRSATKRWAPILNTKKKARVGHGKYQCAGCKATVPLTLNGENNVFVDHIDPVVDPRVGFVDWNTYIDRLFCEEHNLQLLCKSCHDKKSKLERDIAKEKNNEL